MRKEYPQLNSDHEIKNELTEMGIDVFEPESASDKHLAELFEEFSHFVLHSEKEKCLEIIEDDFNNGGMSVGELQGGSDVFSIYRISFPSDDDDDHDDDGQADSNNAAIKLLNYYNQEHGLSSKTSLTVGKIKQYMLTMCDRRSRERNCRSYTSLGNLMFILQLGGPTNGQVRHIDNMVPNLQICLYMSSECPSTVVYAMDDGDGLPVTNANTLIDFWERQGKVVPGTLKEVLIRHGDTKLNSKHTKYLGWSTINLQLLCFGKLYQHVEYQLGLQTEPGTTLLAGGNEIHAGPPTKHSRMFAFAIGVPEDKEIDADDDGQNEEDVLNGDDIGKNDGEVQYSPVLFHIDFCCLLFSMLDHEYKTSDKEDSVREAKRFLVEVLVELIRDYPMNEYLLQIDQERDDVRTWLESILSRIEEGRRVDSLVEDAVQSDRILYTPDLMKRRPKKKKKKPTS
mmetsp:Transcript_17830/g.35780  ORF Transcript_17830/g.35780 Transcript_17830/m.35780 type:complete len:454 (-) Transcript_17830:2295-3656(-)